MQKKEYSTWRGQPRQSHQILPMIQAHGDSDECLDWPYQKNIYGYGTVYVHTKRWLVHRYAFKLVHGRIYRSLLVIHSCDRPCCYNPKHLSQGTYLDNVRDMDRKGRRVNTPRYGHGPLPKLQGEKHHNAKYTSEDILTIRRRWRNGETQSAIARDYNVSQGTIGNIVRRVSWKHLPEQD